jgi:hypothetical protein
MSIIKYFIVSVVVTVGLLGDFAMGGFVAGCVVLFYLFLGDTPRRPNSERYERETPPKNQNSPYNPND